MINTFKLICTEILDNLTEVALIDAIASSLNYLQAITVNAQLFSMATVAFGDDFDTDSLVTLGQQWQQGDFSGLPEIHLIPSASINGANGAYAHSLGQIFLSQEFVTQNEGNVEAIAAVILEELGHFLERQGKEIDTPGDEGRHFAALVLGETITEEQLQQWQNEDDWATVILDGELVEIEQDEVIPPVSNKSVDTNNFFDTYTFTVNQSGIFTANLAPIQGDTDVLLFQDLDPDGPGGQKERNGQADEFTGEILAWQWERGENPESIRRFINPGTYSIEVRSHQQTEARYNLSTNFEEAEQDDQRFDIILEIDENSLEGLNNFEAIERAAQLWESVIPYSFNEDQQSVTYSVSGNDLGNKDEDESVPIGQAGGSSITLNTHPSVLESRFNRYPDYLTAVVAHEIGHVLGVVDIAENFVDRTNATYNANTYAGWAYGELLGAFEQTPIPVTTGIGAGSDYVHWSEDIFDSELMTPRSEFDSEPDPMQLSQLTIAALRDIGWNVNYGAAQQYSLAHKPIEVIIERVREIDDLDPRRRITNNSGADFYGTVNIGDFYHRSPTIGNQNDISPNWVFTNNVPSVSNTVIITIRVDESDRGGINGDDHVDINGLSGRKDLILEYNFITGDIREVDEQGNLVNGGISGNHNQSIHSIGSGDSSRGEIWFRINPGDIPGSLLGRALGDVVNLDRNSLQLYVGDESLGRSFDTINEINEVYTIGQSANGVMEIFAFGQQQTFNGITDITANAGDGNDIIQLYPNVNATVVLEGGSGNDLLIGGAVNDTLDGGEGLDTLYGNRGNDRISGGSGNDIAYGGEGSDRIEGEEGNDTIWGDGGDDHTNNNGGLFGGSGDDEIHGGFGADYIEGNGDNDRLYGDQGSDTVKGGFGNDLIHGGGENDTLEGNDGEDIIHGEGGNDNILGGHNNDHLYGGLGGDNINGDSGNDYIEGNGGNDTLEGSSGNDSIYGHDGNNTLRGGTGNDFLDVSGYNGQNVLEGGDGEDDIYGGLNADDIFGGNDSDDIFANEGNDIIEGNAGNDNIEGNAGNDTIQGGEGRDNILGGMGEDSIFGDLNIDNLNVPEGTEQTYADIINGGADNDTIFGQVGGDRLSGDEGNDSILGGTEDDYIEGNAGNDTLEGGADNDLLIGSDQAEEGEASNPDEEQDELWGGDGNDTLIGGIGDDLLFGDDSNDRAFSNQAGNDVLDGGDGDDQLYGGLGFDILIAGQGDDWLSGGLGNDVLDGGRGNNVFVISPGSGTDVIENFQLGNNNDLNNRDVIRLSDGLSFNFISVENFTSPLILTETATKDERILREIDDQGEIRYEVGDFEYQQSGVRIVDLDTGDVLAYVMGDGVTEQTLTRGYFDEENVPPNRLEFESQKPIYARTEDVTLVHTVVRDANGTNDLEIVDFWLRQDDLEWEDIRDVGFQGVDGSVTWGDIDGDGDQDFLVAGSNPNGISYPINIYINDHDGETIINNTSFRELEINLPSSPLQQYGVTLRDYDNNGTLDILGYGYIIPNTTIEGEDISFGNVINLIPEFNVLEYGLVSWEDFNNDNLLDFVITGINDAGDFVKLYQQDGISFTEVTEFDIDGQIDLEGNVLTFDYNNDENTDLLLTFQGELVRLGSEFQVNTYTGDQQNPSITALNNGGFVVTWQSWIQDGSGHGIYGQRFNSDGEAIGLEFQVNTYTDDWQTNPSVTALENGGFVVTWQSQNQDGSGGGVYGQLFDSNGEAVGAEFQVNTYTIDVQQTPSVTALNDGGFVVIWDSQMQDVIHNGIYGQRFNSNGEKVGEEEFRINSNINNQFPIPSVTTLADGGFIVIWESYVNESNINTAVYGQRFNSDGEKVGEEEFLINTYSNDGQRNPSVTALNDGGFVVTWQSLEQDGSGYGIYGQRFNSNGEAVGLEFQVNTYTNNNQRFSSVIASGDGGFIVTWESFQQDGSGYGIYGQRFNSDGEKVGTEFLVNTNTNDGQNNPSITALSDGQLVITWSSNAGSNIYGQRFEIIDRVQLYSNNDLNFTQVELPASLNQIAADSFSISEPIINTNNERFLLVSGSLNNSNVSYIYRLDAEGNLIETSNENDEATLIHAELEGVINGDAAWTSFDDNGDGNESLFVLLTGSTNELRLRSEQRDFVSIPTAKVYRYDGNNQFTEIETTLPELYHQTQGNHLEWRDYNHDNIPDLLLAGTDYFDNPITKVFRNDGYGILRNGWRTSTINTLSLTGIPNVTDVFVLDNQPGIEIITNFETNFENDEDGNDLLYLSSDLDRNLLTYQSQTQGNDPQLNYTEVIYDGTVIANIWGLEANEISDNEDEYFVISDEYFVISLERDSDPITITNFDVGTNFIYLQNGLNLDELEFISDPNNDNTDISRAGETLLTLENSYVIELDKITAAEATEINYEPIIKDDFDIDRDFFVFRDGLSPINLRLFITTAVEEPAETDEEITTSIEIYYNELGIEEEQVLLSQITLTDNQTFEDFNEKHFSDYIVVERLNLVDGIFTPLPDNPSDTRLAEFQYTFEYEDNEIERPSAPEPIGDSTNSIHYDDPITYTLTGTVSDHETASQERVRVPASGQPIEEDGNYINLQREFLVNTNTDNSQINPSVTALADGGFLITWQSLGENNLGEDDNEYEIYAQLFNANGTKRGEKFLVNTETNGFQENPSVTTLADGGFIIVWDSYGQDEHGYRTDAQIYAQRFNANGTTNGNQFQVNTYNTNDQNNSSITALLDGGFIIAWESYEQDGSLDGIYAQLFNADGTTNGNEFQVNTYTDSLQSNPSVIALDEGFIITWESYEQDGDSNGIYAQLYNADGTTNGNEFQVNTYNINNQYNPSVTALVDGGFIIAWESFGQDGDSNGIYAQRYHGDGTTNGNEFQVNTYTRSNQTNPSVTALTDDGYVITWESFGQDGSLDGIYAQRYHGDGTTNGGEFRVNTYTDRYQVNPSVTALEDGDFIITWSSDGQDDTNNGIAGIYAQVYYDEEIFILGDSTRRFYGYGGQLDEGQLDDNASGQVALIKNEAEFNDLIQLYGSSEQYRLQEFYIDRSELEYKNDSTIGPGGNRFNNLYILDTLRSEIFATLITDITTSYTSGESATAILYSPNGWQAPNTSGNDSNRINLRGNEVYLVALVAGVGISDDPNMGLKIPEGEGDTETTRGNLLFVSERDDFTHTVEFTINNNGEIGDDTIQGTTGDDTLTGGDGNDFLIAQEGSDYLDGGRGDDSLLGSDFQVSNNQIIWQEDNGNNQLYGWEGNDTLFGGNGEDTLDGGEGNDQLTAGPGDDTVEGGEGEDTIDGGDGNDLITYAQDPGNVTVILPDETATDGYGNEDTLLNIENAIGSQYGDSLQGDDNPNLLMGLAGDDTIQGGEGNDTLRGGAGNDRMDAGDGDDLLESGGGADSLEGGQGSDRYVFNYGNPEEGWMTPDEAFTALTGGQRQQRKILRLRNGFEINLDTWRRWGFDSEWDRYEEFGVEVDLERQDAGLPYLRLAVVDWFSPEAAWTAIGGGETQIIHPLSGEVITRDEFINGGVNYNYQDFGLITNVRRATSGQTWLGLPTGQSLAGSVINDSGGNDTLVLPTIDNLLEFTPWSVEDGGNGHFYVLTDAALTWEEAEQQANAFGGHLVTINNAAEQEFIEQAFLSGENERDRFWIGFNDVDNEGNFVWSSGESSTYTNWTPGEPSNPGDNEDYAVFNDHYHRDSNRPEGWQGTWNDVSANTSIQGLIEIEPNNLQIPSTLTLSLQRLYPGRMGFAQRHEIDEQNNDHFHLVIDLNQDGVANPDDDLVLENYFNNDLGYDEGDGLIETFEVDVIPSLSQSLSFDGDNDYISLPSSSIGDAITIEAWVYVEDVNRCYQRLIDFGNAAPGNNIVVGWYDTSGRMFFHIDHRIPANNNNAYSQLITDEVFPEKEWVHVAAVNDGMGNAYIYWNGRLIASDNNQLVPENVTRNNQYIGRSNWSHDADFQGEIDEVRIWNIARSEEEIRTNFNQRITREEAGGLVAYYNFEEINNNQVIDQTNNNNNGTINGATRSTRILESLAGSEIISLANSFTTISLPFPEDIGEAIEWQGSSDWGDIDNDGDLDALITGLDAQGKGVAAIYRYDGNHFNDDENNIISLDGLEQIISTVWGDYNHDGKLDILLFGYDNVIQNGELVEQEYSIKIYQNNFDDATNIVEFIVTDTISLGQFSLNEGLAIDTNWGDFDNDGDLDIIILQNSQIKLYRNHLGSLDNDLNTPDIIEPFQTITLPGLNQGSIYWRDYDQDGKLDLFISGWDASQEFITVHGQDFTNVELKNLTKIYLGDGQGNFTEQNELLITGVNEQGFVSNVYHQNIIDTTFSNNLQLNGDAILTSSDSTLRLTHAIGGEAGSAFLNNPLSLANNASFSSHFEFQLSDSGGIIDSDGQGADGFAFVISTDPREENVIGVGAAGIGYLGITPSFTIEFDTWDNGGSDPNGNHIGISLNGNIASVATETISPRFNNGANWNAWIDYIEPFELLEIRVSPDSTRPENATLSYDINLREYFNAEEAYFGFTAATFGAWNNHDILSWDLQKIDYLSDLTTLVPSEDISWGDYNNDGNIDVIFTRIQDAQPITQIYTGDENGEFTLIPDDQLLITSIQRGEANWGDYDYDGDLDIIVSGAAGRDGVPFASVYRNNLANINSDLENEQPTVPNKQAPQYYDDNSILLSWEPSEDDHTPPQSISYNLKVGTTPGGSQIISALSNQGNNITGRRKVVDIGNVGYGTEWVLEGLTPGETYYWNVQGIDQNWIGSNFDSDIEEYFTVNFVNWEQPIGSSEITNVTSETELDFIDDITIIAHDWGDYDNNGTLDLVVVGQQDSQGIIRIYKDNSTQVFEEEIINNLRFTDVQWGDYNNDNYLDLLTISSSNNENRSGVYISNQGYFNFEQNVTVEIGNIDGGRSSIYEQGNFGDYDNDGDLDILLADEQQSIIVENEGFNSSSGRYETDNEAFEQINKHTLGTIINSFWVDYDNDGDLDIILSLQQDSGTNTEFYTNESFLNESEQSRETITRFSHVITDDNEGAVTAIEDYNDDNKLDFLLDDGNIYLNTIEQSNNLPTTPINLTTETYGTNVNLIWTAGTDQETSKNGLSYNLRVSNGRRNEEGEFIWNIVPPASLSDFDQGDLIHQPIENNQISHQLYNLGDGVYYWQVETVDTAFTGSGWSDTRSFVIGIEGLDQANTIQKNNIIPELFISSEPMISEEQGQAIFTVTLDIPEAYIPSLPEEITVTYETVQQTANSQNSTVTTNTLTFNNLSEIITADERVITTNIEIDVEDSDAEDETFSITIQDSPDVFLKDFQAITNVLDNDLILPDLEVTSFVIPSEVEWGRNFTISGTIENPEDGIIQINPYYEVYLLNQEEITEFDSDPNHFFNPENLDNRQDKIITSGFVFSPSISPLGYNNFTTETINVETLIPTPVEYDDQYHLLLVVDPNNQEQETNEDNNYIHQPITINPYTENGEELSFEEVYRRSVASEELPDLTITNGRVLEIYPDNLSLRVQWTVENVGTTAILPTNNQQIFDAVWETEFYLSKNNQFDIVEFVNEEFSEDNINYIFSEQDILPGETLTLEQDITFDVPLETTDYLNIVVFPEENIDADIANNVFITSLTPSDEDTLDIDGNHQIELQDYNLIDLYASQLDETEFDFLINNFSNDLLGQNATRTSGNSILAYLNEVTNTILDVDGNNQVELQDYNLIDLYAFQLDETEFDFLINNFSNNLLGQNATRTSGNSILAYFETIIPETAIPVVG